jgi:hypothetical protein
MQYKPSTTLTKAAAPAAVIIAGSNLLQIAATAAGIELGEETSYVIITTIYSLFKGLANFVKNRRKR